MKTCAKCGFKNAEDAKQCVNCLIDLQYAKEKYGKFHGTARDTKRIGIQTKRAESIVIPLKDGIKAETNPVIKPPNDKVEKLKEKPGDRNLVVRNPDEFFVKMGVKNIQAPAYCPRCSKPAHVPTHILAYNYAYDTGTTIMFGLIGQLFRFLLIGSSASTLLEVVTCEHCHRTGNIYKSLEWASRALGIILTGVLIVINTTPELPLIKRGFITMLLALSPLVIGALLALMFRNLTDEMKGITFVRSNGVINLFRVQSDEWLREFTRENVQSEIQPSTGMEKVEETKDGQEPLGKTSNILGSCKLCGKSIKRKPVRLENGTVVNKTGGFQCDNCRTIFCLDHKKELNWSFWRGYQSNCPNCGKVLKHITFLS